MSSSGADLVTQVFQRVGFGAETRRVDSRDDFNLMLTTFAPDVVLADPSLAQIDALAALEILHVMRPSAPLIVVSGGLDEHTIVECLRAGANDIVLRGHLGRLPAAIESALGVHRPLEKLSPRQLQVLRLVAEGQSTPEIARSLRLSVKTVESHRTAVMRRLGIHDVVALVRYAVRVGLVSPDNRSS